MAFTFGIYPGGVLSDESGTVHPATDDDPRQIVTALQLLQGDTETLLVRAYRPFYLTIEAGSPPTPLDPGQYAQQGRKLELVLPFRESTGDLDAWLDFVRRTVATDGARLASLQICEEPNADQASQDGSTPGALRALVTGVSAAKQQARALGYDLQVGFNAVLTFGPARFWYDLAKQAGPTFHGDLDFVGLDFFPDVFAPIPAANLAETVAAAAAGFRRDSLGAAGISDSVPLRVTENGWPTGPGRSEERQAAVLETIVRTLHAQREALNLTGYTYFNLRDADTSGESLFHGFGLLRDDYSPKPAFNTYRSLIAELS